jgi:RimJ/RimL family protein N-acetyltransferase
VTVDTISTARLDLELLGAATLRALLSGDREGASRLLGRALPAEFPCSPDDQFLRIQLERIETLPAGRNWCVRAIVHRAEGDVIGHAGFHGPPELVGRAEIGYTVFTEHRGEGYATEAARALTLWAYTHGQRRVFASISPANPASTAVVRKLGFRQTGIQIDEVDGEELVFERAFDGALAE